MLASFDVVIIFNKNSFDRATTENTLELIKQASPKKSVFYIYSNPVFEASFQDYKCIFEMQGWHKNWNTKVFLISA